MPAIDFFEQPTLANFDEQAYLLCNEDVQEAISTGKVDSGQDHFAKYGEKENRLQLKLDSVNTLKEEKIAKIASLLKKENPGQYLECISDLSQTYFYNFLDEDTKQDFKIVETENVSQNPYDAIALQLIEYYRDGNILDFGAGFRRFNYSNIINYEIVKYISTDVVGVGEKLPFKDSVFDCIFSFAVLEHVKDPFACAREIVRCLKPGGMLYIVVPHLQPYHGYPHHYYNMTHQGLANLFSDVEILHQEVNPGNTVIWSVSWIIQKWAASLPPQLKHKLLELKFNDAIAPTPDFLARHGELVSSIPPQVQLEIAAATSLIATKSDRNDRAVDVDEHIPALKEIIDVMQSQHTTSKTQFYQAEVSKDTAELSEGDRTSPKKSVAQKIEHILRTTLHYFRLWKRDLLNFD